MIIISTNRKFAFEAAYSYIITGFFMLSHEIFEGLAELEPDSTTYELLELIAFSGLVLFLYEWYIDFEKNQTKKVDEFRNGQIEILTLFGIFDHILFQSSTGAFSCARLPKYVQPVYLLFQAGIWSLSRKYSFFHRQAW